MSDAPDMLKAALAYANAGWPVFPCNPDDTQQGAKRPLVTSETKGEGGVKLATTDEAQIRDWWTRWPDALIGVPTGSATGGFAVDLDPRDFPAEQMQDALARWLGGSGGIWTGAGIVRTQSGGLHIWFAMPDLGEGETLGNRANLFARVEDAPPPIGAHVDIRGEGGYVIVPPSRMRSGRDYSWERRLDRLRLSPAPRKLIDVVMRRGAFARDAGRAARPDEDAPGEGARRSSDKPAGERSIEEAVEESVRRYCMAALDNHTRAVAEAGSGSRNQTLNNSTLSLATLVAAGGLNESVVRAAMEDAASRCGLTKDDGLHSVRATIDSAFRAGLAQPHDLSEVRENARQREERWQSRRGRMGAATSPHPSQRKQGAPEGEESDEEDGGDTDYGGLDLETLKKCRAEPQNDTGNGKRLLFWFGSDLVHVREVGWHFWADTHWEMEGGREAAMRAAQMTAARIELEVLLIEGTPSELDAIEAAEEVKRDKRKKSDRTEEEQEIIDAGSEARKAIAGRKNSRRKYSVGSGNSGKIKGMIDQAEPHRTFAPTAMDTDPMLFNVKNGTLHFRRVPTGKKDASDREIHRAEIEMKPHNRKDLITKKAGCAYDPDGVAHRWEEFLEIFQPDETVRRFLQVYCGYALTGAADEQMLVFNYGHGANGKSTFMEAVSRALGQYARTLNAEAVSGDGQRRGDQATPEIAQLPGARLVNIAELPKGTYIKENLIKALTGGERMQARHLNKGFFDFYPSFKAMMSGNDKPQIQGTDHGIWRRIKLVHWPVSIDSLENFPRRKMSEVLAEFEAESAGILNWMLNGLEIYLTEGMKVPAAVEEFTQEYRDEVDVLGNFIASCIDRTGDPEDRVQARPMFEVYQRWAHENSITPCKETRFGRDLPEKGLRRESDRGRNFYIGVKLKPDWQPRDTDAAGDGREGPPVDAYAAEADSRPDPTSSSPPRTPDRE